MNWIELFLFNLIQPTGIRKCEVDFPMWFYTWKFEFQIWKFLNNKCELQIDRNVPFGLRSYVSLSLELQEGLYITDNFDFELDWCIDSVIYYCQYILIFRFLCKGRISFSLRYIFLHDGVKILNFVCKISQMHYQTYLIAEFMLFQERGILLGTVV